MADITRYVDRAFEQMEFPEIAESPVDALQGLSARDAEGLKKVFDIHTVRDLARNIFVLRAQAICFLADR